MFNPKPFDEPNFHVPKQCIWLKLNGSWPLNTETTNSVGIATSTSTSKFVFLRSYFSFFYLLWSWYVIGAVATTIYFQTVFLISNFGDIMMTTENCCTTFMGALNFVRLLHFRFHQKEFKNLIENFVENIWISKKMHSTIANECEKNMNTFRVMTALLSCLIMMYCFLPLVQLFMIGLDVEEKPFPYKMIFPYDAHHGIKYALTYIFTAYAGMCVVTTLFAEDTLLGFFVIYTCGQFRFLHEQIDNLIYKTHENEFKRDHFHHLHVDVNAALIQEEYHWRLKKIAKKHAQLINFVTQMENFFSPILLVNFLISSILICMVGFQLLTGKDMFIGDYVKFIVYISSSLSQLFILCWNGDNLIKHGADTALHLFSCNWEGDAINLESVKNWTIRGKYLKAHDKFLNDLRFMIMSSQKVTKLTAWKFSTLSLQSFTAILSTSMSYFALLQTLYNKN